jgi:hypothetical protein
MLKLEACTMPHHELRCAKLAAAFLRNNTFINNKECWYCQSFDSVAGVARVARVASVALRINATLLL